MSELKPIFKTFEEWWPHYFAGDDPDSLESACHFAWDAATNAALEIEFEKTDELIKAAVQVVEEAMPVDGAAFSQSVSNGALAKLAKRLETYKGRYMRERAATGKGRP